MKPLFCPKCHKRVMPPKFLSNVNIQGNINLKCGDVKCKGEVKIKNKKSDEKDIQEQQVGE